jgi:hypothetical protein
VATASPGKAIQVALLLGVGTHHLGLVAVAVLVDQVVQVV